MVFVIDIWNVIKRKTTVTISNRIQIAEIVPSTWPFKRKTKTIPARTIPIWLVGKERYASWSRLA